MATSTHFIELLSMWILDYYVQFHSGVVLFFVNFWVRVRVSHRVRV